MCANKLQINTIYSSPKWKAREHAGAPANALLVSIQDITILTRRGHIRWASIMASAESQHFTLLNEEYYDVSAHFLVLAWRVDPGRFRRSRSVHHSISTDHTILRTPRNSRNCLGNAQATTRQPPSLSRPINALPFAARFSLPKARLSSRFPRNYLPRKRHALQRLGAPTTFRTMLSRVCRNSLLRQLVLVSK
jgi:hypothetical protein